MKNKIFIIFVSILILNSSFLILNCPCQWQTYTLPYDGLAYELAFYNLNTGVSCGHTVMNFSERIYYTTNSGNNWILATYPPEIRALANLQFINASTVYACGAENVYSKFAKNYVPGFNSIPFYIRQRIISKGISEYFSEYKTAFLKSTDAGMTWNKAGQFDTTTGYMNDIHFFNENTGYAIIDTNPSTNPKFYKTTNAGANWNFVSKISDSLFLDNMHFFDMNTGFVCGGSYLLNQPVQHGLIFKTTNAGLNWIKTATHPSPCARKGWSPCSLCICRECPGAPLSSSKWTHCCGALIPSTPNGRNILKNLSAAPVSSHQIKTSGYFLLLIG